MVTSSRVFVQPAGCGILEALRYTLTSWIEANIPMEVLIALEMALRISPRQIKS